MNDVFVSIVAIITISFVLEQVMQYLNGKSWSGKVPEKLQDLYNGEEYTKAQNYDFEKKKLSRIGSIVGFLITMTFLFFGVFNKLYEWSGQYTQDLIGHTLLFFGMYGFLMDILNTPLSLYSIFVIEEKYGFNRTTVKTFLLDKLKGYLLGGLIGGSLLGMFIVFYQVAGTNFWWIAWLSISGFTLLLSMFYASIILPLFNKLTPLPEGELRTALINYCNKVNFPVTDLFVMDGSKRSAKANAFFSGLGPKKKIVLFDTLIEKHTVNELVAVMAHEVGHYKRKHTYKMTIISILHTGLMMFLLGQFINSPALSLSLGSHSAVIALGMIGFFMLYSPVSILLSIVTNLLSRKHEYEADNFAKETFGGIPLMNALKKLSKDNLTNLTPHPAFVFMYYSHPTLLQRINNLEK
ncbi:MAG: M48 family metallopeptidase [Bacteroidota bacterium]